MALTTYAELRTAIADRLHRSDLTAQIVDYITLAETRLNRLLRVPSQEIEATIAAVPGTRSIALPALFGSPIALYLTTYLPRIELGYRLASEMQVYSDNGPAQYWTIDQGELRTDTPADQTYSYVLRYSQQYDLAATSTNTLLTNHPDLYLYASLIEAASDLKDDAATGRHEHRFGQALQEAKDDLNMEKSIATLTTELVSGSGGNIIRGF